MAIDKSQSRDFNLTVMLSWLANKGLGTMTWQSIDIHLLLNYVAMNCEEYGFIFCNSYLSA